MGRLEDDADAGTAGYKECRNNVEMIRIFRKGSDLCLQERSRWNHARSPFVFRAYLDEPVGDTVRLVSLFAFPDSTFHSNNFQVLPA